MLGQCQRLRLAFDWMVAVDGRTLDREDLTRHYRPTRARRTQCRELSSSEIGCALSHIAIYRRMVADRIPCALVLEDDAVLPDGLPAVVAALERLPCMSRPTVVLLSPSSGARQPATPLAADYALASFRSGFYTHAYVVSLAGARALLRTLYPVGDVADCWNRLSRHRVVDVYTVQPCVVTQDQVRFFGATTGEVRALRASMGWLERCTFKARRVFWRLYDLLGGFYDRTWHPYAGLGNE